MNGPTQNPPPTLADYQAAEARLREVRDEAAVAVQAAQERGDVAAGNEWASKLQKQFDDFKAFREGLPRDVLLSIHADRILESFFVDKDNFVSLTIPADVSDEDAIHALNARFRNLFPDKDWAAINEAAIEDILDAEGGRRGRGSRVVKLIGVVTDTRGMTRDQQAEILREKGLAFAHPIEQALAAAAYACKRGGEDLFEGLWIRGSVPGIAVFDTRGDGVYVDRYNDDRRGRFAASGSAARLG